MLSSSCKFHASLRTPPDLSTPTGTKSIQTAVVQGSRVSCLTGPGGGKPMTAPLATSSAGAQKGAEAESQLCLSIICHNTSFHMFTVPEL